MFARFDENSEMTLQDFKIFRKQNGKDGRTT